MDCALVKTHKNTLAPADRMAEEFFAGVKIGQGVLVSAKKMRNIHFHRKFFALLGLAFDAWETPNLEYKGIAVKKDFERFRSDTTILAGHYEPVFKVDGSMILRAKSISFAKCDEYAFNDVYQAVLSVVWERILCHANYRSEADVEQIVNRLLAFS